MKNIGVFVSENFQFLEVKFSIHLNRSVFVMVVRPADEGLGIVVIEKENFIQSLQQEIEQCNSYAETEFDLTKEGHKKVKKIVNKMVRDGTATKEMH